MLSPLEQRRAKFKKQKQSKALGDRQNDTMAKLMAFSSKLSAVRSAADEGEGASEAYHGQVGEKRLPPPSLLRTFPL